MGAAIVVSSPVVRGRQIVTTVPVPGWLSIFTWPPDCLMKP